MGKKQPSTELVFPETARKLVMSNAYKPTLIKVLKKIYIYFIPSKYYDHLSFISQITIQVAIYTIVNI